MSLTSPKSTWNGVGMNKGRYRCCHAKHSMGWSAWINWSLECVWVISSLKGREGHFRLGFAVWLDHDWSWDIKNNCPHIRKTVPTEIQICFKFILNSFSLDSVEFVDLRNSKFGASLETSLLTCIDRPNMPVVCVTYHITAHQLYIYSPPLCTCCTCI